jgi:predicted peptidase
MRRPVCLVVPLLLLIAAVVQAESPQQEKAFEKQVTLSLSLKYLLYLPPGYEKGDKRWPLVVFLHGRGEVGEDLQKVKIHGPPKLIDAGRSFPFVVLSPQSPQRGWNILALNALLDQVLKEHRIDEDRVYLTGLSMGGRGTWDWAAANPERFAALAPICGSGNPQDARGIKDIPVWAFHGAKDPGVLLERSEDMVKVIQAAGGSAKLTVYPEAAHDAWTVTYNNPELYNWLLEQKRSERGVE